VSIQKLSPTGRSFPCLDSSTVLFCSWFLSRILVDLGVPLRPEPNDPDVSAARGEPHRHKQDRRDAGAVLLTHVVLTLCSHCAHLNAHVMLTFTSVSARVYATLCSRLRHFVLTFYVTFRSSSITDPLDEHTADACQLTKLAGKVLPFRHVFSILSTTSRCFSVCFLGGLAIKWWEWM
jgi:hypothetical protein